MPRLLGQKKVTTKQRVKAPLRKEEWSQLLRKALQRAEVTKDPRITQLKKALSLGQAERCLRQMSIINDADLIREFPIK